MTKPDLANQALLRRAVIRYALRSPESEAKAFVTAARQKEPKLVADVEEFLKYEENARKQELDRVKQTANASQTAKNGAGGK